METIAVYLILAIVLLHHVGDLAYRLLHWPPWLVRHFDKGREAELRRVLDRMGFGDDFRASARSIQMQRRIEGVARHADPFDRAVELLRGCFVRGQYEVGRRYTFPTGYFVDVLSASLDPRFAEECTNILTSHVRLKYKVDMPVFDAVVGLKAGSPILAYKFAERLSLPCVMFRGSEDYKCNRSAKRTSDLFDGPIVSGAKLLIVDDSTTGGRMVLDCLSAVEDLQGKVTHCLVLFEPLGKGAREALSKKGVELIAVARLDQKTLERLSGTD